MIVCDQSVIFRYIRNVFKDEGLDEKSNMQNMHIAIKSCMGRMSLEQQ